MEAALQLLLILVLFGGEIHRISTYTDPNDVAALQSFKNDWENVPPSWQTSNDPCGTPWDGVTCNKNRVTELHMSAIGIKGKLEGDIGGLTALISLDLSNNPHLTGPLSARLGDLKVLNILILLGCSFSGSIPEELGNLGELTFLALNSNKLIGKIPPSLGKLSKLYWLDLADNQLSGPLPVSTATTPGLDSLLKAKHFHFNKNKLSDSIPLKLFSSQTVLIHLLFDGNQFTGEIPESLGLVKTLEVVRLDRNALSGEVPSSLNNLTNVNALHMEHNKLSGSLPDLSGMNSLTYVDLSNNSFLASEAPDWFSKLPSLTTVVLEYGSLEGPVPNQLFSFPQIQQVKLRNNAFDKLIMSNNINPQLVLVDLQNNKISTVTLVPENNTYTLMLVGNPVCSTGLSNTNSCKLQQQSTKTYYTKLANCGKKSCKSDQKLSPHTCDCEYPFEGTFYFTAPHFRELFNATLFQSLEVSLRVNLRLSQGSVSLQNLSFNTDDYLEVQLGLFPTPQTSFNMSEIQRIGFQLRNRTIIPNSFGPYSFHAYTYSFTATHGGGTSISRGVIVGIIVGCAFLIGLLGLGIYAISQKKRAEKAIVLSKPFASWAPSGNDSGGAPQLKGARWFSYDELKKCTSNFSANNEIGSGGYGKVYRGLLPNGQVIAIKRARDGSMQGGPEFKNEIELLSRVHHKNLVGLVGFCFEQGEQMLVYEFMPNGTLRESLSGRSGIYLDWKKRLQIALGSARGLAYLHELADPPIIHRDIKSTNILLDEHLTSKVTDFGLSKLVSDGLKGHVSTQVKGTLGYLDPEYYMTQQLTNKSDVYSYGVVMLELITTKQPIVKGKYIVREVRMTMDKNDEEYYGLREMMDPSIINNTTYLVGFGRFLELAMQCVQESADDRPTMSEIVKAIEAILQNEGTNTNSTSISSSATDFGTS